MKKLLTAATFALGATAGFAATPLAAQDQQALAEQPHYSVETTAIGTLLDDPQSAAILQRLIPTVYDNDMFQTMGRPNTLRTAAQYESAVLTETKMAEIQAEFDKLAEGTSGQDG